MHDILYLGIPVVIYSLRRSQYKRIGSTTSPAKGNIAVTMGEGISVAFLEFRDISYAWRWDWNFFEFWTCGKGLPGTRNPEGVINTKLAAVDETDKLAGRELNSTYVCFAVSRGVDECDLWCEHEDRLCCCRKKKVASPPWGFLN